MMLVFALSPIASARADVSVDFGDWSRDQWLPVREERFPTIRLFVQEPGRIANPLPPGAAEADVVAAKDGLGVATMLLRAPGARDVSVRCRMGFERKGAPAILLRTQRQAQVTGDTYSLVLYEDGLNLWKFAGGRWSKVGAAEFAVAAGVAHDVRVYARDGTFGVYVDGDRRLSCRDAAPLGAGEVGIWSGEGPCWFESFSYRALTSGNPIPVECE